MAEFQYTGVDKSGSKVQGKLEAPNEGEARVVLRGMGIRPTAVKKPNVLQADLGSMMGVSTSVKLQDLIIFIRQLQALISSGVPLVQSLDILGQQSLAAPLRNAIVAIKEKVSSGAYFWEAMAAYPRIFPKISIALIRAGEASGSLDQMLKRLSRYLEDADRIRKMVKSAMLYPALVMSAGLLIVLILMVFVIPRFEGLLKNTGQELPVPTQIVLSISNFLAGNALFVVGGLVALVALVGSWLKSPTGKDSLDRMLYRLPLFGPLVQKAGVARFCRTMTTLLASGVTLVDAVEICRATIDNSVLEDAVGRIRAEVEQGKTLGSVMSRLGVFPSLAVQMISVGEATGALDRMLEKVADFYEMEVETLVGGLTKLIEPLVLIFLGAAIGGLMLALYLPIFKIAGAGAGGG
jgi:type IV pilus assembly protein PilC